MSISSKETGNPMKEDLWSKLIFLFLLVSMLGLISCGRGESPAPEEARTVYVVNEGDDTVSVIDGISRSVIATIPVGKSPHYIVLDPSGKYAYVTNGESNSVTILDTTTNRVISTIEGVGGDPQQIVIHPEGKFAYVPGFDTANVHVVDLVGKRIIATIPVGDNPQSIAISPGGERVYVVNLHSPQAMVIDTATNKVIAKFTTGEGACGIATSPDGHRLYLGGHGTGMWRGKGEMNRDVRVMDARTFAQLLQIRCGIMPIAVKFSRDGQQAYVVSHGSSELHFIDITTNKTAFVKVGHDCRDVADSKDGKWAYVSNRGDNTVSVVDIAAKKAVATIKIGKRPLGVALK
jgi:YVTN family beta-propeller protein